MLFYIELFSFSTYFRKMKKYDFIPQGVCSRCIHLELTDDDIVVNVSFDGGCHGNLQGIAALVHGMHRLLSVCKASDVEIKILLVPTN